jgi:hypothetical protein
MESAKTAALEEALSEGLFAERRSWGNLVFNYDKGLDALMTNAERKAKTLKKANTNQKLRENANIEKKKAKFVNRNGLLKKIAKQCKWECQGEKCWAHTAKTCPYIHKNQKGSNKNHAVTLKKNGGRRTRRV